ncbi:MAG TPA: outer membrane protein assembly factor BamD [Terracidiphilus sp.]|nr:outer membrane protein assembly factor BamD [Terracidiphilus sp.]
MNRLSKIFAAGTLLAFALGGASANAKVRHKKKDFDLKKNPLAGVKSEQPDLILYNKAMQQMKKGHYDVARLDLQTLLNTYCPDSQYCMRAKLSVGDTWFKEGGTAAMMQAEAEYKDFIVFYPDAPEAAEAQMKVADIYYDQMEKPDRDYTNADQAEQEYRNMINQFPDSQLVPRAKQRLRDVQEVLAEREFEIGSYYEGVQNYNAAIARLQTVADSYPLFSKSDQVLIAIGDSWEGEAHNISLFKGLNGAVRERLIADYENRAAQAYAKVITRYPMAPHVEDARDRLVAMNRPIPTPNQSAIAESEAEESSRQPLHFTDTLFGLIKRGPTVVEAVHVGDPTLTDPTRTLATDVNKQNTDLFNQAINAGKPPQPEVANQPTSANEPPRSDRPSEAPVLSGAPAAGTSVGVQIVNAPNGTAADNSPAADPNALVKPVTSTTAALPAAEKPATAPPQVNDIKPGEAQTQTAAVTSGKKKQKAPKADLGDESSSRKKKKKGLGKLNPF